VHWGEPGREAKAWQAEGEATMMSLPMEFIGEVEGMNIRG
jgi:hypothetical protein